MRPQEFWDSKPREMELDSANPPKKSRSRKRKMSAANIPQSEPQTEIDEPINVPPPPPPPVGIGLLLPGAPGVPRKVPCTPSARSAREANAEWTMAVSAGARTARSSPVREGTADSPIELDQEESPITRNLFGASPKGAPALEASPKIGAPRRGSPRKSPRKTPLKSITNLPLPEDKENAPPTVKINDRNVRECTPEAQTNSNAALFKTPERRPSTLPRMTPQRMTPLGQSPWRALFGMTPKSASRKPTAPGSPSPASLERLLAQLNSISPKDRGAFGTLLSPTTQRTSSRQPVHFDFDEDLFSTDIAMPSSPPAFGFSTDQDGHDPSSSLWSELLPSPKVMQDFQDLLGDMDASKQVDLGNIEMTVDFSNFIEESESLMAAMLQKSTAPPSSATSKST